MCYVWEPLIRWYACTRAYNSMYACLWIQTIFSICTSWLSIGMGLKGVVLLNNYLSYQTKQTKKIRELKAQVGGELVATVWTEE